MFYMVSDGEKNYLEWFKKADEDELSIKAIMKNGGAFSTACFLSQQMAEKYLKGLIVFHGLSFTKVHDLLELETILLDIESEIKNYESELDLLSSYYTETRYPGDYPEFTQEEAGKAFEAAKKIKDFVLKIVDSIKG